MRVFSPIFLLIASIAIQAATFPFFGVVLEAETDIPVSRTTILYASGKELARTDASGRFELELETKNAKLLFIKEGYDTLAVETGEFLDPMDVVILMVPNVRNLGQSTILSGESPVKFEATREVQMESLEDAAGMRFDLTEHLSQMPGISGQQDFSNALYYDGSRAEDVSYHLGKLRVPNMRHLDIGFPGNFSVVNPHVLSGIEFHDHYGKGPIDEGLAASVQYLPDTDFQSLSGNVAVATTMFEGQIAVPFFIFDDLRVAVRVLNQGMLENMGDKFFSEFGKESKDCSDCRVSSKDPYKISAYDGYVQLFGKDSSGNTFSVRGLYSNDQYTIRQDTASRIDVTNSVNIFKGEQEYALASFEYDAFSGGGFFIGIVNEYRADTLRDTTGFRRNMTGSDAALIDAYDLSHTILSLGIDKSFRGNILGASLSSGALLDWHFIERSFPDNFGTTTDLNAPVVTWVSKLNWKNEKQTLALAGGAVFDFEGHAAPLASADFEQQLGESVRVFGGLAERGDWKYSVEGGKAHGFTETGASAKLGAGYRTPYMAFSAHGFGRYYNNPELPTPKAFAQYRELSESDYAWVSGASATFEWKTSHHLSVGVNATSSYGEYELADRESSLPWESNARLDMVTHLRYYPRKDSMLSFIVSHHAAWNRPLYYYEITLPEKQGELGTRRIRDTHEFTDLFRTDLRINLDFTRKYWFIDRMRFFVEADNILANLDVKALRFLGGENARERSQVTDNVSSDGARIDLVPLMAKGMGLYLQFGVEISFGS